MDSVSDTRARKRAAVACDTCRKRKRRCNGSRPRCRLCENLRTECHYQEPVIASKEGPASTQRFRHHDRLGREFHEFSPSENYDGIPSLSSAAAHHVDPTLDAMSNPLNNESVSPALTFPPDGVSTNDQSVLHQSNEAAKDTMTIPFSHSTTTGSLLHMPQTSDLLGQYPVDLFFRIEQRRLLPPELSLNDSSNVSITNLTLDRPARDQLVEKFFMLVNSQHPILDATEFCTLYEKFSDWTSEHTDDYALCLMVLALGEAASKQSETNMQSWAPGTEYFTPSLRILLQSGLMSFGTNIALPQGLYLAALYFSYLTRPLLAWKLVHMASTNAQHLWIQSSSSSADDPKHQSLIRLMWAIFVLECDIIAEYHLPRSGIEHVVDNLPFPRHGSPPADHMLFWLADLSARRLLNRVHHTLYNVPFKDVGSNVSGANIHRDIGSYTKVSNELRHQLETWYNYLPISIKPDLRNRNPTIDETILILRYHASGDIISRPFVFHVCALPDGTQPPDYVLENCKTCIHHCHQYLQVFDRRIVLPSAALAVTIIMTLASHSPLLGHLVAHLDELQQKTATQLERWASPGSSIEAMLSIAKMLIMKRSMMQDWPI
ncbi:hypothetical protein CC80DRAFT_398245 [Byssothecium circinans]|uniref:Zn(2)-C6 fungal-type domain-containing protein n=1 Tax=Byssothecium circinans TaxID=147558 RepID=A0A6A5UFL3_9PLEO|nr:hypothetical protein CC80DRAFT_398245 [Byssothecium circinans]